MSRSVPVHLAPLERSEMPNLRPLFALARWTSVNVPAARPFLMPLWTRVRSGIWRLRRLIAPTLPIKIPVKNGFVQMLPEGQVAEQMWGLEFERDERAFVCDFVKPGMTVINVGANTGLYVVMCGLLVGPRGKVLAFEPSSATFDLLRRNVALNNLQDRANLVRTAVADFEGTIGLAVDEAAPNADGHVRVVGESDLASFERAPCLTLDKLLHDAMVSLPSKPKLMIIDVEGAELGVLHGAVDTIDACEDLTIMLECSRNHDEVASFLSKRGFAFYRWDAARDQLTGASFRDATAKGDVIARRQRSSSLDG